MVRLVLVIISRSRRIERKKNKRFGCGEQSK